MKFLRMRPGHGEQLIAEGDLDVAEDAERLVEEFRRQLDRGMWAAVPLTTETGRREAEMITAFEDIPTTTDRVIFFPRAAGGAPDETSDAARAADGAPTKLPAGLRTWRRRVPPTRLPAGLRTWRRMGSVA